MDGCVWPCLKVIGCPNGLRSYIYIRPECSGTLPSMFIGNVPTCLVGVLEQIGCIWQLLMYFYMSVYRPVCIFSLRGVHVYCIPLPLCTKGSRL